MSIITVGHTRRVDALITQLRRPAELWSYAEISHDPCPVPAAGGTYGWHFTEPPHPALEAHKLLYIGVSPGSLKSRETLRSRIRYHFQGDAEGSTLRMSVGCLLGLPLHQRPKTGTFTFGRDGEAELSSWLAEHGRVCWHLGEEPWKTKPAAIAGPMSR